MLTVRESVSLDDIASAQALLNSYVFDWLVRQRLGGAALTWSLLQETVLPAREPGGPLKALSTLATRLNLFPPALAHLRLRQAYPASSAALCPAERLRLLAVIDAISAAIFGCDTEDLAHVLRDTDLPRARTASRASPATALDPRGFWRVDRDKPPELRHTVLTQIAFAALQRHIAGAGGDQEAGIQSFMAQNESEGWLLPDTLRLTDHGLGHDERATHHQPVATELGPRFYDWQLTQPPEEAQRETQLHSRNLLGDHAYRRLLKDLEQAPDKGHLSDSATPLSEVAEERHSWDNWLTRTDEDSAQPTAESNPDQPDLFD